MSMRYGLSAGQGALALAVPLLLAVTQLCYGARPPSQDAGSDSAGGLVIKTPSTGLEASGSVKASQIGLPVYPGAAKVTGKDQGNLSFVLKRKGKPDARLLVAKFETADSPAQVRDFYRSKLANKVTKYTKDANDSSVSFEMKSDNQHGKYVQIKPAAGKTEIDLVRIEGMDLSERPN